MVNDKARQAELEEAERKEEKGGKKDKKGSKKEKKEGLKSTGKEKGGNTSQLPPINTHSINSKDLSLKHSMENGAAKPRKKGCC